MVRDARNHLRLGEPVTCHGSWVQGVAFRPDSKTLASAGDDETIMLWDARSHLRLGEPVAGHGSWVQGVALSPYGKTLASATDDRTVMLWDAQMAPWQLRACTIADRNLSQA